MTTPVEANVLAVAIVTSWLVFIGRFLLVLHRGLTQEQKTDEPPFRWSIWAVAFFLIMAGTTYHPASVSFFQSVAGEWFGTVPRTISAIMPYLIGSRICCEFLPTHQLPRWRWPLYGGLLIICSHALLLSIAASSTIQGSGRVDFFRMALADPLFHFYILNTTARIIIPTLTWLRLKEEYIQMKLRLTFLIAMYLIICFWMVSDIIFDLLTASGIPNSYLDVIRPFRVAGVSSTFLISFFAPPRFYKWLAEKSQNVSYLLRFIFVRHVECCVCSWTEFEASPVTVREVLREPGLVIYRSTITTLDARKMLTAQRHIPDASKLAARLEFAAQPDLSFPDVVARLSRIGRDCWWRTLRGQSSNV